MAPNPQESLENQRVNLVLTKPESNLTGEEIVISGISGIFPKSANVEEFMNNLYNKVDMVTNNEENWPFTRPDMPKYSGKVARFEEFDAQFFKIPYGQGHFADDVCKKILENSYGAFFDAGINPTTLAETKVGVFVGSAFSDMCYINFFINKERSPYSVTGVGKALQANRVSYWIDSKGISLASDSNCGSSSVALEQAFWAMKQGTCTSAIVAGANQLINPKFNLVLRQAGLLCLDGKTKCFDRNADGFVRSEAVSVLYLQKASVAKRIYAEIVYTNSEYSIGLDLNYLLTRKSDEIEDLLHKFYSKVDVLPKDVEYVEAFGAGIASGDANELQAIGKIFANGKVIKVGSVKSNMGHTEAASGVCAIIKVCLAYYKGELPGNLHYNEPPENVAPIQNGSIQIVTENVPFNRGYTALNCFSISGTNHHTLMKGHYKKKNIECYYSPIPRLILLSGRINSSITKIWDSLKSQPVDAEQISLLHDYFAHDISGHTSRGYIVLDSGDTNNPVSLAESIDHYPGTTSPVWFLYSGMGSQWPGMGAELMKIPTFAASIERCRKILEPKGLDIIKILTSDDKYLFDNILHSFVGIAAMQIGLTDLLEEIGIFPDNIVGHSVGEVGCAYADKCCTIEQTILLSYYRGLVSIETEFIDGLMAAVKLGHEQASSMCPPEIEVVCHNSLDSSTISGPAKIVKKFVKELKDRGIFAKEVQTSNIAYHSKYIAKAGPQLLSKLKDVLKEPKLRSKKWVCSSVSPLEMENSETKYASAEYFTNNLLNYVYFEEAASKIPSNAIIIEISPHGIMQAIMKQSHVTCTNIPLTYRNHPYPVIFLLEAVGKIYKSGLNPKISSLYPKVKYPVSTETPLISPLVGWAYDEPWTKIIFQKQAEKKLSSRNFAMILDDDDWKFIKGHVRNGAIIFPEAALLVLVWETLAMQKGLNYRNMSIIFETITFDKELYIKEDEILRFNIGLQMGSERFEICQDGIQIASGFVRLRKNITLHHDVLKDDANSEDVVLTAKDIYNIFRVKGYSYKDQFQSIISSNIKFNEAYIKWNNEWITFLNSLIQLNILSKNYVGVSTPMCIRKLTIDTALHAQTEYIRTDNMCMKAINDNYYYSSRTRCGGVEIEDVIYNDKPLLDEVADVESLTFVPYIISTDVISLRNALKINLEIVTENIVDKQLKIVEILTGSRAIELNSKIKEVTNLLSHIHVDIHSIKLKADKIKDFINHNKKYQDINLFVVHSDTEDEENKSKIVDTTQLNRNVFVLNIISGNVTAESCKANNSEMITFMNVGRQKMMLLRKPIRSKNAVLITFNKESEKDTFSWLASVKSELQKGKKVVVITENSRSRMISIVKSLKRDGYDNIRLFITNDHLATEFTSHNPFFKEQLEKHLTFNIWKKESWGGYYYLLTDKYHKIGDENGFMIRKTLDPFTIDPCRDNLVQVNFAGLSLYDFQKKIKNISNTYGMDFSGYNSRGERVMGLVPDSSLASTIKADPMLLWPVPPHWSLEDAATVPLHYALAYYCLFVYGKLYSKDCVLVIGGAGALGQAVISLCLSLNYTVFATVSNEHKKQFLMKMFPRLKEDHIFCTYSNTLSFYAMLAKYKNLKLCKYVISCATGEMREEAMECVGLFGTYISLNTYDEENNLNFITSYCDKCRSYKAINLSNIFKPENFERKQHLHLLMSKGLAEGIVKPISRIVYSLYDLTKAFNGLVSSKRIGKVLINVKDDKIMQIFNTCTRPLFSPKASYLIIGDESVLEVELADWLIKRGAKNVIFNLKNDSLNSYILALKETWNKHGVQTSVHMKDLSQYESCDSLLNECEKIAPLHGIFVIHSNRQWNNITATVANLDKASKICHLLNDFVIICNHNKDDTPDDIVNSAIENICEARNNNLLPALFIQTHVVNEIHNYDERFAERLSMLFNALNESITKKYKNIITRDGKKNAREEFFNALTNIVGIPNVSSGDENKPLRSFNISELCYKQIRHLINKTFQIDYTTKELQQLTFARFKHMYDNTTKQRTLIPQGLRVFYNFVESDEIQASEPIVNMPGKISDCSDKTPEELDSNETHLIMIPGFEGHSRIFSSVVERLKIQAVTLQLAPDLEGNNIPDMASNLFQHIKRTFQFSSKFYILGYSFGVNIALELAALLENEGYLGVVYCLDSSPDALRVHLDTYLGKLTKIELQKLIIKEGFHLLSGKNSEELNEVLEKSKSWSEKVDSCLQKLRSIVTYSDDYQRAILETIYKRICLSLEYEPNFKLQSELVLVRGILHPNADALTDDYNLSTYTKKPVKVFDIESDHSSAPYNCRISNIINKALEPKLLDEYKNMNLCETYFSGESFKFQRSTPKKRKGIK